MTNGEKFKQIFPNIQIDMGEIYIYVWIDHEPAHITKEWWSAEYKEPTTKNDVPENNVGKIDPVIRDNGVKDELNRVKDELAVASELEKNSKKLEKDFGELDCISRADAIQAMQDKAKKLTNEDTINGLCGAVAILFDLPPATPQQPKGYWIDTNDNGFVYHRIYKCSHCGATVCEYPENMHESKYKYCSSCGSRNEVEE